MPTTEIRQMRRRRELCPATEVDGDHPSNICNGKLRTTDEFVVRKPRVQPLGRQSHWRPFCCIRSRMAISQAAGSLECISDQSDVLVSDPLGALSFHR